MVTIESAPSTAPTLKSTDTAELNSSFAPSQIMPPPAMMPHPPVTVSTPVRARRTPPLSIRDDIDNESTGCHSDILDFDNWSETASNGCKLRGITPHFLQL